MYILYIYSLNKCKLVREEDWCPRSWHLWTYCSVEMLGISAVPFLPLTVQSNPMPGCLAQTADGFLPCSLQDKKKNSYVILTLHEEILMSFTRFWGLFLGRTLKCVTSPQPFLVPRHGVWRSNTSARCGCAYERADRELDIASMTPMVRRCRSRTPVALSPAPG